MLYKQELRTHLLYMSLTQFTFNENRKQKFKRKRAI